MIVILLTAMFYVLLKTSFGADTRSYDCSVKKIGTERFEEIEKRLVNVNIEHKDFEDLIKQYGLSRRFFTEIRYITPPKTLLQAVF